MCGVQYPSQGGEQDDEPGRVEFGGLMQDPASIFAFYVGHFYVFLNILNVLDFVSPAIFSGILQTNKFLI